MKFEQLTEEMKRQSGLSYYYFEMLKSIGWDWEEFLRRWCNYTLIQEKNKKFRVEAATDLVKRAGELGERLGYIFKKIREADKGK